MSKYAHLVLLLLVGYAIGAMYPTLFNTVRAKVGV